MQGNRRLILGMLAGLLLARGAAAVESQPPAGAAAGAKAIRSSLTAAQIVDKHVAARGGLAAWRAVQTLSLAGKMDAGSGTGDASHRLAIERRSRSGKAPIVKADDAAAPEQQVQLPFALEMKRPRKSRLEIEFAGKTAVQVYDGTQGWKKRPFLNREDVEPFSADELKNDEKRLFSEAAAIMGTTTAGFVRAAAKEKARALLEQETRIVMSARDFAKFAAALDKSFAPNKALEEALKTVRSTVRRA